MRQQATTDRTMTGGDPTAEATSPVEYLAAPSALPSNGRHRRSISSTRTCQSSQSHVTFLEDKNDDSESEISHVRKQQTFKIGLEIGWLDLVKAFFNRRVLTHKIEQSIKIVPSDSDESKMYPDARSPFDIEVHVVPKSASTNDIKTRCLLDTGCLPGNIVSREFIDSLGYEQNDFEPLTYTEKEGYQSITGERLTFEAAILMSWYHDTMPLKFRDMRFLISPTSTVDMIIGTRSIVRYNLLAPPVLHAGQDGNKVVRPRKSSDKESDAINAQVVALKRSVANYTDEIKKQEKKGIPDKTYYKQLQDKLEQKKHDLTIKKYEEDIYIAHKAGNTAEENRLKQEMEKEKESRKKTLEGRKKSKPAPSVSQATPSTKQRLAPAPPSAGARASTP